MDKERGPLVEDIRSLVKQSKSVPKENYWKRQDFKLFLLEQVLG